MKNIIFLAPPAAGKGTCSDILKNTYDCKHISTGAILRSEIASQSSLGKEIKKIILRLFVSFNTSIYNSRKISPTVGCGKTYFFQSESLRLSSIIIPA